MTGMHATKSVYRDFIENTRLVSSMSLSYEAVQIVD